MMISVMMRVILKRRKVTMSGSVTFSMKHFCKIVFVEIYLIKTIWQSGLD